jgi:hypothetical protein
MAGIKMWRERGDRVALGRLRGGGTPRNGDGATARDDELTRASHLHDSRLLCLRDRFSPYSRLLHRSTEQYVVRHLYRFSVTVGVLLGLRIFISQ